MMKTLKVFTTLLLVGLCYAAESRLSKSDLEVNGKPIADRNIAEVTTLQTDGYKEIIVNSTPEDDVPSVSTVIPNDTTLLPSTTTVPPNTSTVAPNVTTLAPNITTVAPTVTTPTSPTTTTPATTIAPITVNPNVTTTSPKPNITTTVPPVITTTVAPPGRSFDGPSFLGGIITAVGLTGIGLVIFKFYKARAERNYHTL